MRTPMQELIDKAIQRSRELSEEEDCLNRWQLIILLT